MRGEEEDYIIRERERERDDDDDDEIINVQIDHMYS